MPYCPECGNEVSRSDKRCSKCGTLLTSDFFANIPKAENLVSNITATKPKDPNKRNYHNIEFILAIIAVILSVYSISLLPLDYNIVATNLIFLVVIPIILGVIGAFVVRYYAKTGAIILLITVISLVFIGVYDFLPLLFYVITIILCFVR